MGDDEKTLEEVVLTRLLCVKATVQGVASGIIAGLVVLIATNLRVLKGGDVVGPHLSLRAVLHRLSGDVPGEPDRVRIRPRVRIRRRILHRSDIQ
jgi:hypothetical protein